MKYNPALDGLRAVTVMIVLAFHCAVPRMSGGYIGVDIFFVLSGFLITTLILNQQNSTEGFSYWNFYRRRFLRLTPPLALMVCLYLATAWIWPAGYDIHLRDSAIAMTYTSDYARAFWGIPNMLRHTWSLSVEEHFYIIWPVLLLSLAKSRSLFRLAIVIALLAFLATVWRQYQLLHFDFKNVYNRFDTHASGLLIGASAACLSLRFKLNDRLLGVAAICSALYIVVSMLGYRWQIVMVLKNELTKIELASAVLVISLAQSKNTDMYSLLSIRPLAYIGKLSYGIYLFHFPIAHYLKPRLELETVLPVTTVLSIGLAALSYHTLEAYFRRERSRATNQAGVTEPSV